MTSQQPFSQACENNKPFILEELSRTFEQPGVMLEIGTGTGQHVVHFARHLPHLSWQPSDHPDNYLLSASRLQAAALPNIRQALALNVTEAHWDVQRMDGIFSANTAHIMSWLEVEAMFRGVGETLNEGGAFCLYGPFRYQGRFTSDSNERFDQQLRSRDSRMGIREIDALKRLAEANSLVLEADTAMPANNQFLIWRGR